MAVVRCDAGHFYDDSRFATCPHCTAGMEDQKTVSGAAAHLKHQHDHVQKVISFGPVGQDDNKTVGIYKKRGWNPVTGWLVCISGPEKGRDYRLHSGRNFLGRAPSMDISITDDSQISRENHCSIVFEPKNREFLLVPGSASIYKNGSAVSEAVALVDGDTIGAGASEFVFIPFCEEGREW